MTEAKHGELQTAEQQPTRQMHHQQSNELLGQGSHMQAIIDVAHRYPRDIDKVLAELERQISQDERLLEECWYSKPAGKELVDGKWETKYAEGPSIRFAEVAMSLWGNLQTCVWQDDPSPTQVIAHARVWDMERNLYHEEEVRGSIITQKGKRYGPEGIVNAGLSAQSKALRNAVTRVIGKGRLVTMRNRLEQAAHKRLGVGNTAILRQRRQEVIDYFGSKGIDEKCLCFVLGTETVEFIDRDEITQARRLKTAIEEGELKPSELIQDFAKAIGENRDVSDSIDDPTAASVATPADVAF